MMFKLLVALLALCCIMCSATAEERGREFVTSHTLELQDGDIKYKAVVDEVILRDDGGQPSATVFSIAYFKVDTDRSRRPIMFLFNGGPGSTAVWLHLGAFGPKRIVLPDDPVAPAGPPFKLEPNMETLLVHADLVFVDPIGTGYSQALGDKRDEDFWGVDEDAKSMAEFIRQYLTKHRRWNSPKFLAGESYGTIRVSLLIRELQLKRLNNVLFNGVIMVSSGTDVRVFLPAEPGNELPYITNLPTYAATAYYHGVLKPKPDDFHQFISEAEQFAASDYLVALFQGEALPVERKRELSKKLSRFTGLSAEHLLQSNLRVDRRQFLKELLRDRSMTIALHDTRYAGRDTNAARELFKYDPFLPATGGVLASAINHYLSNELKVDLPNSYKAFSNEANETWRRPHDGTKVFSGYLNTTRYLAQAATNQRTFRVFVASGYHDLTTTFFGAKHTFNHSGISSRQLTVKNYDGGHMMYLHQPTRKQLSADIIKFLRSTIQTDRG